MAFPQPFLDELNARCDIVELVGRYVKLKRSGANYFGLCPFHNEKTPSFSVAPDKQLFYCFGCGAGGGPVNFIMRAEGLPYPDAVRFLAQLLHLEVPEEERDSAFRRQRARMLALNKAAARFYYELLHQPVGQEGLEYFQNRGLTRRTMNRFGLGYAPEGWSTLLDAMGKQGFDRQELVDAGLAVRSKTGSVYDRFRNRVIFPIIDIRGDVVAFGGRVLDDSLPKYLNSPESLVFHKSRNLFALNLAKKTKAERMILAEGYMDVIALHQAGFDSAVASLGTSLTQEQARLISRYVKQVVVAYDADGAGQKAAQRAIEVFRDTEVTVKILRIPGAKDPDEFIREKGAAAFARLMDQSENHVEFRLDKAKEPYDLQVPEQKVEFVRQAAQIVASLDSPVEREVYTAKAAQLAQVTPEVLAAEVAKAYKRRTSRQKSRQRQAVLSPVAAAQPRSRELTYSDIRSARAEEGVLRLIFADNSLLPDIRARLSPEDFSAPVLADLYRCAGELYDEGRVISVGGMESLVEPNELAHLTQLLSQPAVMVERQRAMEDYITVIQMRKTQRESGDLERMVQLQREKKGYGGTKR